MDDATADVIEAVVDRAVSRSAISFAEVLEVAYYDPAFCRAIVARELARIAERDGWVPLDDAVLLDGSGPDGWFKAEALLKKLYPEAL